MLHTSANVKITLMVVAMKLKMSRLFVPEQQRPQDIHQGKLQAGWVPERTMTIPVLQAFIPTPIHAALLSLVSN